MAVKKNTGKSPSVQFYYKDFLADMQEHPTEIIGAWILVLIKIWHEKCNGEITRNITQFAKIMNTDETKAQEYLDYLKSEKIADVALRVTEDNKKITVVSRRTKRDAKLLEHNRLRQERFRDKRTGNGDVARPKGNPSSSSSTSTSYSPNSKAFGLSKLLFSLMLQRKSDYKKPNLQTWAKHIDRMIRLDGRKPEAIEAVIRWSQADPFWEGNILCTEKLRLQFDRLEIQMRQNNEGSGSTKGQRGDTSAARQDSRPPRKNRDYSNQVSSFGDSVEDAD